MGRLVLAQPPECLPRGSDKGHVFIVYVSTEVKRRALVAANCRVDATDGKSQRFLVNLVSLVMK